MYYAKAEAHDQKHKMCVYVVILLFYVRHVNAGHCTTINGKF